jgi:hypothetical protein
MASQSHNPVKSLAAYIIRAILHNLSVVNTLDKVARIYSLSSSNFLFKFF